MSAPTVLESYAEGDLNNDGFVDEFDFISFKNAYTAAGGSVAALEAFAAGVPEPTTLTLLGVLGALVCLRRPHGARAGLIAIVLVGLVGSAAQAQLTPLLEYRFPASYDGSSTAVNDLSTANNDGTATVEAAGETMFDLVTDIPAGEPAANRALDYSTTYGVITTNGTQLLNNAAVEAAGGFTYDLWFNPRAAVLPTTGLRKIIDYAGTEWIGYIGSGPGGLPTIRVSIGNGTFFQEIQTGFDINGWNHIRYVFDSTGNTIDENGDIAGEVQVVLNDTVLPMGVGTKTAFGDSLDRPLALGHHPTAASEHYRGLLYNPSVYLGAVPYQDPVTLQVNTTTGAVSLTHETDDYYPDARNIDFYKITSADGSIVLANWSSLDDQNFGVSTNPIGDYNDNGTVDAADYTVWRDALNTSEDLPNDPTPGVDETDYATWKANFGSSTASAGWTEVGAPTSNAIGESFVTGSTILDNGLSHSLGDLFQVGGEQDWILTYHVVGEPVMQTGRVLYSGAGAGSSQAVPEPTSALLMAIGVLGLALVRRWPCATDSNNLCATGSAVLCATGSASAFRVSAFRTIMPLVLIAIASVNVPVANAAVTLDRQYLLGEGAGEGGSAGSAVGSGNGFGLAFDNAGEAEAGNLQDLTPSGGPVYASVSARPLAGAGTQLGAQFDGADDYLFGARLGLPASTQSSTAGTPAGPEDYSGITHRGLQFWTNPLDSSLGTVLQSLVVDTNQHGVLISDAGTWVMKYRNINVDSGVPVATGEGGNGWSHVMLVQPNGPYSGGSFLYVDGIAVAAATGGYVGTEDTPLVVGSNTSVDAMGNFTGGTADFFTGIVDDLEMFVTGTSVVTETNYGEFNFGTDNEFAADALVGTVPGDVTGDGQVTGDGTGSVATDDVAALIANWGLDNRVNNVSAGDLSTREQGDFNFDGLIDLGDWDILRSAHAGGASLDLGALLSARSSVPEPTSLALLGIACGTLTALRRRRAR